MKKILSLISGLTIVLVAAFALLATPAVAAAPNWDVTGTYQWLVLGTYAHDMNLTMSPDGSFTGTGGYPAGGSYTQTEIITGQVTGNAITLTTTYSPGPYSVTVSGTIAPNGSMSGNNPWEWHTTSGAAVALLSDLSPANIWLGLKNSDDVGTKFDLEAKVYKNGVEVGSGLLLNQNGGSSGFNNASLRSIALTLAGPTELSLSDTLSIKLSVRIAEGVAGHRSGTARLWYNDTAANSSFDTTVGEVDTDYYLRDGFVLDTASATVTKTSKKTADVFVDKLKDGNAFKPFGTWSIVLL